ncbi:MAG: DUF2007 domain-containing protein, partial [Anaerolineae bacterium]|nr:DUF2007 domain-containing protein [Anaerolineae bacterium]
MLNLNRLPRWLAWLLAGLARMIDDGPGEPPDEPWVAVASAGSLAEADVIAARLALEDIPAYVRRESASTALPLTVGLLGEIDVMVPASEEARARS